MHRKQLVILSLALAASGVAFAQTGPVGQVASTVDATTKVAVQSALTEAQVRAKLEAGGYTKINDVKFEDGVWKADAKSADGNHVDVRIDAKSGEIFPDEQVANLNEASVKAKLAAAGYTNIHDVDYEDGIWNAEADDPAGKDVEVKIDPKTGEVIGKEKD